jgi:alpha/beta superfamily hydrolase
MVLAGQYLERSVVIGDLDALYHRGTREPPCVIASPHPALGGSMTSPVIAELAWALTRAGHATMRFDYRGVGASRGQRRSAGPLTDVSVEVADVYLVADQLLATTHAGSVCAVGYSFGAKVALEAASDPRISQLVLIAPPTSIADFSGLSRVGKRTLVVCGQQDTYCDRSRLPAQPEVIPYADHFFHRGLTELGKLVAEFLRQGRPPLVVQPDDELARPEEHREIELPAGDEDLELDLK